MVSLWKKSSLAFVAWPPSVLPLSQATDYGLRRGQRRAFGEGDGWQSEWFAWSRRKKWKSKIFRIFWPPEWGQRIPDFLASLLTLHTEQVLLGPILEVYENYKIREHGIYDVTVSCHEEIVNVIKVIYNRSFLCVGALPPLTWFSFPLLPLVWVLPLENKMLLCSGTISQQWNIVLISL